MKTLRRLFWGLRQIVGEADYERYCAHLRAHHPERRPPTAKDYYLSRLDEKYARPTRCC